MKAKKLLPILLSATAFTVGLSGCSDFDNDLTERTIKYDNGFREAFGEIDPNQDWNLAKQAEVHVSDAQGNVQIYVKSNGKYLLVGDYANVEGTQSLKVDVPKGSTDLMVVSGNMSQFVNEGGYVSFASTRAIHPKNDGDIRVTLTDQKIEMDQTEATKFTEVLPESEGQNLPYSSTNLSKVTQDFKFVSNGEFTIFPTFWDTNNTNEIGLYCLDEYAQLVKVPIYTIKSGTELQYLDTNGSFTNVTSKAATDAFGYQVPAVKLISTGIKVSIPKNTVFGMYIKPSNADYKYSESKYNEDATFSGNELTKNCYGSTFTLDGQMYLGFEDWVGTNNFDMNDVMFRFDGNVPTTIDESGISWDIACEDLGDLYDYDFNDVVFNVQHISGRNTATVTPLAAGGTLQAWLYNSNKTTDDGLIGDTHALLNGEAPDVINAYGAAKAGDKITFEVPNDFTMAYTPGSTIASGGDNSSDNMGGFYIKVNRVGTKYVEGLNEDTDVYTVKGPRAGHAPQMILVPGGWDWPTEGTRITDCYEDFGTWGAGYYTNLSWFNNKKLGASVVKSPVQKIISSSASVPTAGERELTNVWVADMLSAPVASVSLETNTDAVTYTLNTSRTSGDATFTITPEVLAPENGTLTDILTYSFNESTNQLTVKPGNTVGTVKFTINVAPATGYYGGTTSFTVVVDEPKTPSELTVDKTSLDLTTLSGAQTIIIKSKSNVKPTASKNGSYFTVSEVTQQSDNDGFHVWNVTVTPTGEGQNGSISISQDANETYAAKSVSIPVTVSVPNLGTKIAESEEYSCFTNGKYKIESNLLSSANSKITITMLAKAGEYFYAETTGSLKLGNETPSSDKYYQLEINSDNPNFSTFKTNGMEFNDWNNGNYSKVKEIWIKVE